ncbi:hypothetical protein DR64_8086 [Paraburkholderia xenovorans LB400]|uniref:DUF35 domain-containing protein n=1 Tax=Paraburkholderia xenovorans (strain LB400) TaxID=266265 RepID=Q13I26_PARXL|nr:OB-fold domain-containing protein [Paraburkholderia xenovorans]ABE36263.1 Conserved hypothetical protein [Paraburkholderia xenovorans LB400]AIP34029.1 hypothetical protein DR64_8086 [Paraburkholderia xenovorans LB400]
MSSVQTEIPLDPNSRPHWEAATRGVLLVQRCTDCGTHRFPAAWQCAHCHGRNAEWVALSGLGRIESFCTFHKAYWPSVRDQLPYTVVQVMLDEGVRYMSSMAGNPGPQMQIGLRVRAWFDPVSPTLTLIRFAPADAPAPRS